MTGSRGGVGGGLPSVGQLCEFPPENTENGTNSDDSPSTIHSYITNHHEDSVTCLFVSARIFTKSQTSTPHQMRHAVQSSLLLYLDLGAESQKESVLRFWNSTLKIHNFSLSTLLSNSFYISTYLLIISPLYIFKFILY